MRRVAALVSVLLAVLALAGPLADGALAAPCLGEVAIVKCGGSSPGAGTPGGVRAPAPRGATWHWVRITDGPMSCYRVFGHRPRPGERHVGLLEALRAGPPGDAPLCSQLAGATWRDEIKLPPPQPRIEPDNHALAGKRVYLQIGGFELQDGWWQGSAANVEMRARPTYEIDWGDGSPIERTQKRGQPYPGGPDEITHLYRRAHTHTVSVRVHWLEPQWRFVGSRGWRAIGEPLQTQGDMELAVQQVQAVRIR